MAALTQASGRKNPGDVMKTPLCNSESESRGWLPRRACETALRLGVFAWRAGLCCGWECCRSGALADEHQLWFAAEETETPTSTASPSPAPSPLSWLLRYLGNILLLSLVCRTDRVQSAQNLLVVLALIVSPSLKHPWKYTGSSQGFSLFPQTNMQLFMGHRLCFRADGVQRKSSSCCCPPKWPHLG